MRIQDKLNEFNIANIEDYNKLFEDPSVKVDVTFWGTRIVTHDGFEGSIPLEEIAPKIISATGADPQLNQLKNKIRLSGFNLIDKVRSFYNKSDEIVSGSNIFTKYLTYFREYKWETRERTDVKLWFDSAIYFQSFNKAQFEKYFEENFEDKKFDWPALKSKSVDHVIVSDGQIANLINKKENKPLNPLEVLIGGNIYKMKDLPRKTELTGPEGLDQQMLSQRKREAENMYLKATEQFADDPMKDEILKEIKRVLNSYEMRGYITLSNNSARMMFNSNEDQQKAVAVAFDNKLYSFFRREDLFKGIDIAVYE